MAENSKLASTRLGSSNLPDLHRDWRKLNTGRLLYESFDCFNAALLKSLKSSEFSGIRHTHLNLLRHVDAEGTRMSDLALRADLTKAAITSLVRACSDLDLVTVKANAGDARSRVVMFSPKGLELMRHIRKTVLAIERRLAKRLGSEGYGNLRAALLSLSFFQGTL